MNLNRCHLDESQRAMVAARLANMPHGTNQWSNKFASPAQFEASKFSLVTHGARDWRRNARRGLFMSRQNRNGFAWTKREESLIAVTKIGHYRIARPGGPLALIFGAAGTSRSWVVLGRLSERASAASCTSLRCGTS